MPALITTTLKHNEVDIALLKEKEDVQYVVDTDIFVSVVYDENTTVSLYFRNATCHDDGIYRIVVQDDTFNGIDIMGTLSIKGKYLHSRTYRMLVIMKIQRLKKNSKLSIWHSPDLLISNSNDGIFNYSNVTRNECEHRAYK